MPVSAKRSKKLKEGLERRAAVRARRALEIQHRLIRSGARKATTEWRISKTKNMSVTGILFTSSAAYRVGDVVEIEVTMSGIIEVFKSFARVVRVVKSSPSSFDVAVKLVELRPRSRSAKSHLKQK